MPATDPFVILYVEDNALVRDAVGECLGGPGRRVLCVADGAAAHRALEEHAVNLLLTDVELPDGSGLDVAREALRRNPGLPVIVCSGHDTADAVRALGPTAHALGKPFDPDALEALVERLAG